MRRVVAVLWVAAALAETACGSGSGGRASSSSGSSEGGAMTDAAAAAPTDAGTTHAPASNGCDVPDGGASHGLTELYTGDNQVISMQLANGLLYFADTEGVWSLPLSGGTATQVAAPAAGADGLGAFAITARHVVWADQSQAAFSPTLHAKPLSGGSPIDLSYPGNLTELTSLVATDNAAYPMVVVATSLASSPLDGGAGTTLATDTDLSGLLLVGSYLYFSNSFSGQPANELLRVPLDGGPPESLASIDQAGGGPMSTDGHNLYFTENLNQEYSLEGWPLSGGPLSTLFMSTDENTSVFTSANGRVYFGQANQCGDASPSTYSVWEIGADKSNLRSDESIPDPPTAMVADSSHVYVATGLFGAAHIYRFAQ